jgi:soluble lytic murein transglycosylase
MYQKIIHKRYQRKRLGFLAIFAICLIVLSGLLWRYGLDFFSENDSYDTLIIEAAERYCVDSCLLKALIWRESKFNKFALGAKGEIGLMQLMREWAVTDWAKAKGIPIPPKAALYAPRLNVEIGTWYLAKGLHKWKKYDKFDALALAEYNAGRTAANKWKPPEYDGDVITRITYTATKNYVATIINKYDEYSVRREAK